MDLRQRTPRFASCPYVNNGYHASRGILMLIKNLPSSGTPKDRKVKVIINKLFSSVGGFHAYAGRSSVIGFTCL